MQIADGGVDHQGAILDVVCTHCHMEGSVQAYLEDVQWDPDPNGEEND